MKSGFGIALAAISLLSVSASVGQGTPSGCGKAELFKAHGVVVWSATKGAAGIFYKSGMAVDADGAYRAYHPKDRLGLDALKHAGHPGNWWALATDNERKDGRPVVQGEQDPAPGYYVSMTALHDPDNPNFGDPHRYVDAANTPYVVLHPKALHYARLGDFATVVNFDNGKISAALVADVSAANLPVGEGSIALAEALGINSDARYGGKDRNVGYVIYAGSGNGKPREPAEIEANAKELFEAWGGVEKLDSCLASE